MLTSSHKGRLFCVRGLRPLTRLWSRSSVGERLLGFVNETRGRTPHFARSYCPLVRLCYRSSVEVRWFGSVDDVRPRSGRAGPPSLRRSGAGWRVPPPACPLGGWRFIVVGLLITFAAENALPGYVSPPSSSLCCGLNSAFRRCPVGSRLSGAPLRGLWGPPVPQAPCKGASPPSGGQRSPLRAAFLFGRALGSSGFALFPSRFAPLGGSPSVAPVWRIAPPRRLLRRRRRALPSAPLRSAWALSKLRPRFPSGGKKPPKGTSSFGSAQIAISVEYSKAEIPLDFTFAFRLQSSPIAKHFSSGGCRPPNPPSTPTHHPMAVIFSEMQLNIVNRNFSLRNFFFNTSVKIR